MRVAIITGASSGMGREFVLQVDRLYKNLDEIWVIARNKEKLEELEALTRTKTRVLTLDLQKKSDLKVFDDTLKEQDPDIRMLVNGAGYGKAGKNTQIRTRDLIGMIDLNCRALTYITKRCLPYMGVESRIINLASAAAFAPQPDFSVYAASKSYVLSFSRSLREELEERGVFVTAVCPGPVATEFFNRALSKGGNLGFLKRLTMSDPKKVVKKALLDSLMGRSMSVYGIMMKGFCMGAKVAPHSVILKACTRMNR